jgi:hypothetical protein
MRRCPAWRGWRQLMPRVCRNAVDACADRLQLPIMPALQAVQPTCAVIFASTQQDQNECHTFCAISIVVFVYVRRGGSRHRTSIVSYLSATAWKPTPSSTYLAVSQPITLFSVNCIATRLPEHHAERVSASPAWVRTPVARDDHSGRARAAQRADCSTTFS